MQRMAENGMTCAEIGEVFGCHKNTVRNRLKRIGYVRGNEWKHAQFVGIVTKQAESVGCTIIGEPTRRSTVLKCNTCGTVREITCTTTKGITPCTACSVRATAERNEKRRMESRARAAARAERREAAAKREQVKKLAVLLTPRVCPRCGEVFHSTLARAVYCSAKCSEKEWKGAIRKRIRKYGVEYQQGITLGKLTARDGMRCYICGKTCDWSDRRWGNLGPDYPTIDHVIPLAKGGGHTWGNVRVACARCNSDKRDVDLVEVYTGENGRPGQGFTPPQPLLREFGKLKFGGQDS